MWVQYYDVMTGGVQDIYSPLMGLGVTIACIFGFICSFKSRNSNVEASGCPAGFLFFCPIIAIIFFGVSISLHHNRKKQYEAYKNILQQHKYLEVEGSVEKFIPMEGSKGVKYETFNVKNIPFSFFVNSEGLIYDKPKEDGGVIDANKLVRIHYYEGKILRLWVWEEKKK